MRLRAAHEGTLSYLDQPWCDRQTGIQLYKDDFIAYFQACYQLKDWLKKDPDASEHATDVERFVCASDQLQLAADVTNRSKHGLADRRTRVDENAQLRSHRIAVYSKDGQFVQEGGEMILVNGELRDALDLAERCYEEWRGYLAERGLL